MAQFKNVICVFTKSNIDIIAILMTVLLQNKFYLQALINSIAIL